MNNPTERPVRIGINQIMYEPIESNYCQSPSHDEQQRPQMPVKQTPALASHKSRCRANEEQEPSQRRISTTEIEPVNTSTSAPTLPTTSSTEDILQAMMRMQQRME